MTTTTIAKIVTLGAWRRFNSAWSARDVAAAVVVATMAGSAAIVLAAAGDATAPLPPSAARAANAMTLQSPTVAAVNGKEITRKQLGYECLRHYGKEVLDSVVNKRLILQECARMKITVTSAEVDQEIERLAKQFGLPVEQWLTMLKQERGIKVKQYANDIIWPMLALRKLAADRLKISDQELHEEFERECGPAIRARIIVCKTPTDAEGVRAAAAAHPETFGDLAKQKSIDAASASAKGMIQPIHRFTGSPQIEKAAFSMQDGEVSQVIPVGNQYVIVLREHEQPGMTWTFEQVRAKLEISLRDRKLRTVGAEVFRELVKVYRVENVWADEARRRQMPGVAAMIGDHAITLDDLQEECMDRYGDEVLEGTIQRRLLEQACKRANIEITAQDLDAEIAQAAAENLKLKPDGTPDVAAWIELTTKRQNISLDIYRTDIVWPSVALKKLATLEMGDKLQVTEDDLHKGFEANYGSRVRCHAIVLTNQRQAQMVWDMLRKNNFSKPPKPLVESFGDMAAQYSVEASSRANRGLVPPVKMHGGQPLLEAEAFSLKPGELSSIIQVDDKFVILLCDGRTEPVQPDFNAVRDIIRDDIREKKLNLAMKECLQRLQDGSSIDNFLAGTSKSPKKADQGRFPAETLRPGAIDRK